MKKLVILLLIIICIYGCEKNNVSVSSSVIGKWDWISSCGGISYHCATPESTNQKINIVFTADSIFNYYENDTLEVSSRFHTYELKGYEPGDTSPYATYIIKYDSGIQGTFSILNGILNMWDGNYDGLISQYKRIK